MPAHQQDGVCPVCGSGLPAPAGRGRARRYCGRACQQAAYRSRRGGSDPAARLADLLSAVAACQAAVGRDRPAELVAAARAVAAAARALAHAARQSITSQPVTKPELPPAVPTPASASAGSASRASGSSRRGRQPAPAGRGVPGGAGSGTPTQHAAAVPAGAAGSGVKRSAADLGDGYTLQPPTPAHPTRWWLCHHDQRIGYVERFTIVGGRTTRWRAATATGRPITTGSTAGRDGGYRTKGEALVQVAAEHQITERARRSGAPADDPPAHPFTDSVTARGVTNRPGHRPPSPPPTVPAGHRPAGPGRRAPARQPGNVTPIP